MMGSAALEMVVGDMSDMLRSFFFWGGGGGGGKSLGAILNGDI